MSEGDAPPRMRAAFSDVRRRLLPKVTEQLYASAKLSFDRKEYDARVHAVLGPAQVSRRPRRPGAAEPQGIPDARHRLSRSQRRGAGDGRRNRSRPGVQRPRARPAAGAPAAGSRQRLLRRHHSRRTDVPVQRAFSCRRWSSGSRCPCWLGMTQFLPRGGRGRVRIIVDERGNVEEARIVESIHTVYDALLLSAARTWKYEPATLDGKPVRYVKMIEIVLGPVAEARVLPERSERLQERQQRRRATVVEPDETLPGGLRPRPHAARSRPRSSRRCRRAGAAAATAGPTAPASGSRPATPWSRPA